MRVLFLTHRYTDVQVGGLAEFLHFLPLALKSHGVETVIYTQTADKKTAQLMPPVRLDNGVLNYSGPFLKPRWFISKAELKPLIELCQQEKIDLVHAQGTYRAGYMAMHLAERTGIHYVVTSHSDILQNNSERMQRFLVQRRCQKIIKHAHFITHLSPLMANASHQLNDASHKSKVIHNGIDVSAWTPYLTAIEQDYMLAIGRLEPGKGFSILIDAYAELCKQGTKTPLVIAGTGPLEQALQTQAKQHQLNVITLSPDVDFDHFSFPPNSVVFTGYVKGNQKKSLFCRSKLVLFATQPDVWEEAFAIVQLEIMAAGKACIASDADTTRYSQQLGMQALLVEPKNVTAWTEAMKNLLDQPAERQRMGQLNLQQIKQFDWNIIAKEYAGCYAQALLVRSI